MYKTTLKERIKFITECIEELKNIFELFMQNIGKENEDNDFDELVRDTSFHFYNQLWSNTGQGWDKEGTIVGHAFSYSKNFVAIHNKYNVAFVFINKYAYTCKADDKFFEYLNNENLPGASTERKQRSNLTFIEF